MRLDERWNMPPPLSWVQEKLLQGYSWDKIVEERFKFGGTIDFLQSDLHCVHKFDFDEIWLLRKFLDVKGIDYLKALYKLEIVSRARILRLISTFVRYDFHTYVNNLCNYVHLLGVFWGSTGRFEASETSDYEFLFIRKETDSTTTYVKRDLNEKLSEIEAKLANDLKDTPEFKGTHPCCTITDYGLKRSWNYMMKHKRPMLVAYLFGYRFFESRVGLHPLLKNECLKHFGLKEIISYRMKQLGTRKFRALLEKPLNSSIEVSTETLKDCGMDTVQSLALVKLGEEAGHSLIDDVLRMRQIGHLNDNQTIELISSVLEIYKARVRRDAGAETIITTPGKLTGFKLAFELVNEAVSRL